MNREERDFQAKETEYAKAPTEEYCEQRKLKAGFCDWSVDIKGSTV